MSEQTAEYFYPNIMGRIMLRAMEEILGNSGLKAVLNHSRLSQLILNYPPNDLSRKIPYLDISRLMISLEELYGERGGQGLAVRSGRACFKYGLREFDQLNILSDKDFRLLPLNAKLRQGAKIFASTLNEHTDQHVWVSEDEKHFYWHMDNCPLCWQRQTDFPACHLAVGVIQEGLFWVSGGKFYHVEESLCVAKGDETCTILVEKVPIE